MLDFFNAEHLALIPPFWAYAGLFIVCVLEGMPVVGSLIAGGTITFVIGTVAVTGVVDPIWAIAIAGVGSFVGDLTGFFLLRFYGERIKILRKLIRGVRDNEGWLSDAFDRKYFAITIVARLIPFIRSAPSLIAAVRSTSIPGYVIASFLASALWSATGVGAGFGLAKIVDPKYVIFGTIVLSIGSCCFGIYKHYKNKK